MTKTSNLETIVEQSGQITRGLFGLLIVFIIAGIGFFELNANQVFVKLQFTIVFLLVATGGVATYWVLRLARIATGTFSRLIAWLGIGFIAGGKCFDIIATLLKTPDLASESNLIARLFLDNGFPVGFVYALGFLSQLLLTIISCGLWMAFIKHYRIYFELVWKLKPRSLIEFLVACAGGSTRFARVTNQTYSSSYRVLWPGALWFIAPVSNWANGLAWLGIISPAVDANIAGMERTLAIPLFALWLVINYLSQRFLTEAVT